jgi:hypothetical protein
VPARHDAVIGEGYEMDTEQELRFIQAFVRRERRERAQFELLSHKKRGAFLSRLCHTYADVLDTRYLKPLSAPNSDYRSIVQTLRARQAPEQCYVISCITELDGQSVRLTAALERIVGFGLPSIVICIPETLAYFEAEQVVGPPPRYLLERGKY